MNTRFLPAAARVAGLLLGTALGIGLLPATASAQKYGGMLRLASDANPPSLSQHEESTNRTTMPIAPVYSNLVMFDYFNPSESLETIGPELAESWAWSPEGTVLTFNLRKGVKWHDGKPFTSADVKHTYDTVRGASKYRLKLNPRKQWYTNVVAIETAGDHQVSFRVRQLQPSLLAILAGSYSPVYPAHIPPAELRRTAVGTGPFRLKSYTPDQTIVLEKNGEYFEKARPYLDGVTVHIIRTTSGIIAALIQHNVEASFPTFASKPIYEQLKAANANLDFVPMVVSGQTSVLINAKKAPLNDPAIARAVSLAMDREGSIRSVFQGGAVLGSALIPAPWGAWGLREEQLRQLPGYSGAEQNKAEARRLLAEKGYGPANPLRLVVTTRATPNYRDPAVWAIAELKAVGVEAVLNQIDTGNWFAMLGRRDYQLVVNSSGLGLDDPDAVFYEHFSCASQRNYNDYCNREVEKLFDVQSAERDRVKRHRLVQQIDVRLMEEATKLILSYRMNYHPHSAYVKNWIPHPVSANGWRLTHVWLDK